MRKSSSQSHHKFSRGSVPGPWPASQQPTSAQSYEKSSREWNAERPNAAAPTTEAEDNQQQQQSASSAGPDPCSRAEQVLLPSRRPGEKSQLALVWCHTLARNQQNRKRNITTSVSTRTERPRIVIAARMSLDIEVPHVRSPSLGVLILTLNLALFLPQTINRTPPYVLAGTGGGSMLGDVNISAILDSFSVGYDKR
ncbi:hypothetical protein pipiens_008312, partial [Culex pipiens pipiens]